MRACEAPRKHAWSQANSTTPGAHDERTRHASLEARVDSKKLGSDPFFKKSGSAPFFRRESGSDPFLHPRRACGREAVAEGSEPPRGKSGSEPFFSPSRVGQCPPSRAGCKPPSRAGRDPALQDGRLAGADSQNA